MDCELETWLSIINYRLVGLNRLELCVVFDDEHAGVPVPSLYAAPSGSASISSSFSSSDQELSSSSCTSTSRFSNHSIPKQSQTQNLDLNLNQRLTLNLNPQSQFLKNIVVSSTAELTQSWRFPIVNIHTECFTSGRHYELEPPSVSLSCVVVGNSGSVGQGCLSFSNCVFDE
ncbi:unnamed protein product [Ambrosiozyma monospora]|uniref:Unnamed protein product n=1 Tax=Ambrosiozyma monospora TaxID=43982 RepID=A0ACB5TL20_AMBMO|nr:unnamed protein product [Ambrosiozyma monospora]